MTRLKGSGLPCVATFTLMASAATVESHASGATAPASARSIHIERGSEAASATASATDVDGAATPAPDAALPPVATGSRGLVGAYVVEYHGPRLRAKPDQAITAPLIVRVLDEPVSPGTANLSGSTPRYRIEFIGTVVGTYDLRELLEHVDGTGATALPPLPVRIDSELPSVHGTDLFLEDRPAPALRSWYRAGMILLVLAWLAIPAVAIVRRVMRRPAPVIVEPPAPPPTLADRLRPLVEAAMRGELSVAERARLELLLIDVWRERLGLGALPPAQALIRLRREPQAGELLRAVEGWLHAPPAPTMAEATTGSPEPDGASGRDPTGPDGGAPSAARSTRPNDTVAALLEPYRAIDASAFPEAAVPRHAKQDAEEAMNATAIRARIGASP